MSKITLILSFLFLLIAAPVLAQPQKQQQGDNTIGTVIEAEGAVTILSGGKAVKGARQSRIRLNDTITTGPKSKVFVLFIDETKISLAENAKMTIDKYVFDPDNAAQNKGQFSIPDGSFKYVSGMLAKKQNPDVSFNTPYGNIGIRGTVLQCGRVRDTYGVGVQEGRVRVRNDGGEVVVDKGKGTLLRSRKEKPTAAAPLPEEFQQAFSIIAAFAIGNAGLDGLIGNALPGMRDQRNLFKLFQQQNGMLPGLDKMLPPGTPLDGFPGVQPQQQQKKKADKPNPGDLLKGFGGFGR